MRKKVILFHLIGLCCLVVLGSWYYISQIAPLKIPSREIVFTYSPEENTGIQKVIAITDLQDQYKVDVIDAILWQAEAIDPVSVNLEKPDLKIMINSPRQSLCLHELRLWFVDSWSIVAVRTGSDWDSVRYMKIDVQDTAMLIEILKPLS